MGAHATMLNRVQHINQPTEFAISKMGSVLLSLRRMKFFLAARVVIVTLWLVLVFYENAEETYVPVGILSVHFMLVVATSAHIVGSVKHDNSRLPERERMVLCRIFFTAMTVEFIVSSLWLAFNVVDVMQCHEYYSYGDIYALYRG